MPVSPALTDRQELVLRTICSRDEPTIREIAESAGIPRSTAQTTVMALVRRGLAEQGSSGFAGGATFHPTAAGREATT